ncbi:SDR family NAD(P)-dependent oxidoreductase [Amorphoplanes digitatis]|uniref:NAD(P)-dependent dehydrogenase (Short-subunit alcohol dehydrogenase family) n=1 Tax=Actinoplanes digitatis TaxID=1868 RepID=A0A7W7I1G9_9ACTN|nr:glucose 1-dehydrogenase [Actinoplanes digitatis]MBB4764744.1 NAD(P)-dependent dehydrogenase (short-subunit alcohol dehydrogenase family) [Actinoplanes digitatis]GID91303.1 short-chain dehydrogenase [Actinoplanes digitatis]
MSEYPRGLAAFSLEGRKALITGGNRGLGYAFTQALADAGASVAFIGRGADANQAAVDRLADAGIAAHAISADLTRDDDVQRGVDEAVHALGGLDIVVNNAGACVHNPAWDATDEQWQQVFDLNVRAVWKVSLAAGRHLRATGGGCIVNIGSISGLIVNRPQAQAPYNASKAAVHQLTKSLAAEWAPDNIRVNAVAPGYVKTEMAPVDRPELRRMWIEDAPQQRYAMPEEIAPTVVYLCSPAAAFVTGSVLVIDGGYTVY